MTISHLRSRVSALLVGTTLLAPAVFAQQQPFERVVEQLRSPDAAARLSALRLLAESGYPEAAAPIAPLLSDPEPRIRYEALSTELSLFLGAPVRKRVALVASRRDEAGAARAFDANWGAMPSERVPLPVVTGLLTLLKDSSAAIRCEAAYALGVLGQIDGVAPDLGYKAVVEALADRMGDADVRVRIAAARAAGRVFRRCPAGCGVLAVERVGDALVHLLNDPETAVQGAAMEGLGEIRYERAVKGLGEVLAYYKQGEMAFGALDTLARIGHPSSIPLFQTALGSKDPNFRRAAVEGLARAGGDEAMAALRAFGGAGRDASLALAVAYATVRTAGGQQVTALVQALGHPDLRAQAQDYLVELGTPVAAALADALPGVTGEARVALLEVLGVSGGKAQVKAVEAFRSDADARVAAAASRTLARIVGLGR